VCMGTAFSPLPPTPSVCSVCSLTLALTLPSSLSLSHTNNYSLTGFYEILLLMAPRLSFRLDVALTDLHKICGHPKMVNANTSADRKSGGGVAEPVHYQVTCCVLSSRFSRQCRKRIRACQGCTERSQQPAQAVCKTWVTKALYS
jgi:hypothetical protein